MKAWTKWLILGISLAILYVFAKGLFEVALIVAAIIAIIKILKTIK